MRIISVGRKTQPLAAVWISRRSDSLHRTVKPVARWVFLSAFFLGMRG